MITIADLKDHLAQFDDDAMIVFRADTRRELYDDAVADDVDYWEPDNGDPDRIRMKAIAWKSA